MSVDVLAFARELIDIDSTTGREGEACAWLARRLGALGYHVTLQPLGGGRANVVATLGAPVVTLSTHVDTVPPFFPSRVEAGRLYGRGACDAKGILAAQVAAAERFRSRGDRRVALLFVVGEERGSDGAMLANTQPGGSRFLINGEPTGSVVGAATRGVLRVRLTATGRAAHSAAPERGVSAIDQLITVLAALRNRDWPADPDLGETFYNVGLIEGGVAPNVIPAHAAAELLFRTVGAPEAILERLADLGPSIGVQEVLRVPVVRLRTVPGLPTAILPFTTDVPFLDRWGEPLLFGPGSFLVAHTDEEHLVISELLAAVDTYERLAANCLRGG